VPNETGTVWDVLNELRRNPVELLVRQWNWKSALFSSVLRALIFLFANLTAGWRAAAGAMAAEFVFRAVTSGFYGSLTQAFRKAQPACAWDNVFDRIYQRYEELLATGVPNSPSLYRAPVAWQSSR
jgi:hypothetical protein